jgi:hypothetical protein
MEREYLKDGTQVYTTGAYLVWSEATHQFYLDGIDETSDTYCDGDLVNFDETGKPFIGE